MAKAGKLTRLRSALKKINSFGSKVGRASSSNSLSADEHDHQSQSHASRSGVGTVYVGKSRRQYQISSEVLDHPLFQELVIKTDGSDQITVACEVVLFDHLLWMLENADPHTDSSLDDLVAFYTC
ncbi:hypothetical protein Ancab_029296 [Ancistrocladus abbreviatus]